MTYQIREIDGEDEQDTLAHLHKLTFLSDAPAPDFAHGHWWLAYSYRKPVAFAGVIAATREVNAGYFIRVGVLRGHRGGGLQLRFMRTIERKARQNGWCQVVSDTTDNIPSANNFIRAGYHLYQPQTPWSFPHALYWRKEL
jgi:GNAT superfamily N-acetyltransferase